VVVHTAQVAATVPHLACMAVVDMVAEVHYLIEQCILSYAHAYRSLCT
jgi:hypothetical protein